MYRVLITEPIAEAGMRVLDHSQIEVIGPLKNPEELSTAIEDVDAILVRTAVIGADAIRRAQRLKVIAKHGVGTDNIDRAACQDRGVLVTVTANANRETVAEYVVAAFLALGRNLVAAHTLMRNGHFANRDQVRGREWLNKTIGVVGYGRIGQSVTPRLMHGLRANILVYEPYWPEGATLPGPASTRVDSLEELLGRVDGLTLHVPLLPETRHLINRERLALMKRGSYLVNAARGPIVDQQALYEALTSGQLAAAALDVFDPEPPDPHDPLLALDNVLVTPHIAAGTAEAMDRMAASAAQSIREALGLS